MHPWYQEHMQRFSYACTSVHEYLKVDDAVQVHTDLSLGN